MKRKIATLFATAGLFVFGSAAPAFAAPVSASSLSLPDPSGIVGSATANAASIVGSASYPNTGATQTANLAIQETGQVATVAVTESNQTARTAVSSAFGQ